MTPSQMLDMARKIALRYGRTEMRDDLAAVACLGMLEEQRKRPGLRDEALLFTAGHHAIINELRWLKRRTGDTISIHHAVTELIEEWKRAPVQEEVAIVSEVRRIAAKALTPPQLDVVMARSREESHRQIAIRRRWSVGKAVKLEQDGMAALCDAVDDDG